MGIFPELWPFSHKENRLMDKVRLQFWNMLRHICVLMLVFSGISALLEYAGKTPNLLKNVLIPVTNLEYVEFLPPGLTETWIPLAVLSFAFAAFACFASRHKNLWHPSGFTTLPAPNGGYLRKATPAQFRKELSGGSWKARFTAKRHFKKAEKSFKKHQYHSAATEYGKSASAVSTMSAYLNEGISLCYTSLFRKAGNAFDKGLSHALGREKYSAFAAALHSNICIPYKELGSMEEAHVSFKEAYSVCMKSGDTLGRLCALGNSGALLLAKKVPDEALQSWRETLAGLTEIRCRITMAIALDGTGRALTAKKDFRQALKHHRKALKIFRTHRNVPGMAGTLDNMGLAHAGLGRRRRSLRSNRKALKLAVSYGSLVDQASIHANMGVAHAKGDRPEEAIKLVEKAVQLNQQIENPLGAARQLANIAVIFASQKRAKEALKKLAEARQSFQKAGRHVAEIRSLEKKVKSALRSDSTDGLGGKAAGTQGESMVFAEQA
jgi:tetratricopeptide (TPR) repeat protein